MTAYGMNKMNLIIYSIKFKTNFRVQKKIFQEISVQTVMSVQNYSITFRTNCSEYTKMIQ